MTLSRRPQERLETLSRVIRISTSISDLETLLEVLMDHLIELLGAERGFIMLWEEEGPNPGLKVRTARNIDPNALYEERFQVSRSISTRCFLEGEALLTSNASEDERFHGAASIREFALRSVLCAPLLRNARTLGVLYADNSARFGAFHEEDLEFIQTFASQTVGLLERAKLQHERDRTRDLFSRYVSEAVVEEIMTRPTDALAAQRRRVSVMFCDLRGFSRLSENVEPDDLIAILNEHLEEATEAILAQGGTVLSFLGDGLLAVFNAPVTLPNYEEKAMRAARRMLRANCGSRLSLGIGIATGVAVLGDLGTSRRREYTVLGDVVNVAARLEKLTKKWGVRLLCDQETYLGITGGPTSPLGEVVLDGRTGSTLIYAP